MRKIILILGLLLLLVMAWAQIPVSMRYYALSTALDGDWEQIYDPINLNFYLQKYYFTNLSDYVQQVYVYDGEVVFKNEGRFLSEYPFGFTFKNPWKPDLKHAFLIRFRDDKSPFLNDNYGESEVQYITYSDNDDDLIYDAKEVSVERQRDYNDMQSRLFLLLNSSLPVGNNVLGARLSLDTGKSEWDEAYGYYEPVFFEEYFEGFDQGAYSSYYSYSMYNLIDDILLQEYSEEGDFYSETSNNKFQCLLSWMQPNTWFGPDGELRYDLNLTFDNENARKINDSYMADYYMYESDTAYSQGSSRTDLDLDSRLPRNEVFINARYRKNLDSMVPRFKQSYWEVSLGMGGFGGPYEEDGTFKTTGTSLYTDSEDLDNQELNTMEELTKIRTDGSYFGWHSILMGRSAINFSENVAFGYGLTLDLQTFDRKADNEITVSEMNYNQIGTAFDAIDDAMITGTMQYKQKTELAQTNLRTILPVGLEFSLPKSSLTDHDAFSLRNFCFRIGTTFIHDYKFMDNRSRLDGMYVDNTVTEYGNGDVSVTHQDETTTYTYKTRSNESSGDKKYSAGIGYDHSDFLSIDVGGYINGRGDEFYIGAMLTVKK